MREISREDFQRDEMQITSKITGVVRFQTEEIQTLVEELHYLEVKKYSGCSKAAAIIFEEVHTHSECWSKNIECLRELDCLCSLGLVSAQRDGGTMVHPEFKESIDDQCSILFAELRYPLISKSVNKYIPNTIDIGRTGLVKSPRTHILTGLNMGGKSTILRQTCLGVIIAQIGCYVPCSRAVLTIVDRIFTRIGACDNILQGNGAFSVEMMEIRNILEFATPRSLAIIDELGRGTSTFDGTALVQIYISQYLVCCIFTTHYPLLVKRFADCGEVEILHMSFRGKQCSQAFIQNQEGELSREFWNTCSSFDFDSQIRNQDRGDCISQYWETTQTNDNEFYINHKQFQHLYISILLSGLSSNS